MSSDIGKIQEGFINTSLFHQALTHRSWLNEHKGERESNERLEFLGDAVLEFVVSHIIFDQFKNKEEGYLTALRANLVNTIALAEFAKQIDLGEHVYLSKGEVDSGGRSNISILADTVEAIIGAIYIDRGLPAAEEFIIKNLLNNLDTKATMPLKDAKSRLQEYVQSKGYDAPRYRVVSQTGPDHNKKFIIQVMVKGEPWAEGEGKSKSSAEQSAASKALATHLEPG